MINTQNKHSVTFRAKAKKVWAYLHRCKITFLGSL